MKNLVKLVVGISSAILLSACSPNKNTLIGAGSSFVYPVLAIWAQEYNTTTGIQVNYQAIGSGGGLQQMYASTVNFAASDMPLTPEQLKQRQLQQFPIIIGGIVPVVNIPEQSAGLVLKVSVVCLVLVIQQGLFISTTITIGIAVAP